MTEEYINKTRKAVNLLCAVYSDDMLAVADIRTSQAKGDTETLVEYLVIVRAYVSKLITDIDKLQYETV